MTIVSLLGILIALALVVEDFLKREVSIVWLICLALIGGISFNTNQMRSIVEVGFNMVILLLISGLAYLVMRWLGYGSQGFIGKGDLIFLLCLPWWSDTVMFVYWINLALICSLIMHYVLRRTFIYKNHQTVPFIGYIGLALVPLIIMSNG